MIGTVTEGMIKGLEILEISGRLENIQTSGLSRSDRILRRVLGTWCHSNASKRLSAYTWVKHCQMSKMTTASIIIIIILIIIIIIIIIINAGNYSKNNTKTDMNE